MIDIVVLSTGHTSWNILKTLQLQLHHVISRAAGPDRLTPRASARGHDEPVAGAVVVAGVVVHAQVVSNLMRHHIHRGEP